MRQSVVHCQPNKLSLAVVAPLVIFSIGCDSKTPVTLDESVDKLTRVKAIQVAETNLERTTVQPASIHAFYEAEIFARATGYVAKIDADIGDVVKAGAELAELHVPELSKQREVILAKIKRLEAEEKRASAGVVLAEASVESATAKVRESKSRLASADASIAAATAEFDRTQDLVARGSLQSRLLDESRKKRDSELAVGAAAKSAVDSATAEVNVSRAQKVAAESDLTATEAETQIARRELEELDELMKFAIIRAPFDGIVSARNVDPGDLVTAESTGQSTKPLYVVSQVDRVRVRIPVPESVAPFVNPGDSVALSFPAFVDEPELVAEVTRRTGSLNEETRTMIVEAEIENAKGKWLPGMFGQATITLQSTSKASVLPARAVRFRENGTAYVYVIDEQETVTIAEVQTGLDDGHRVEIVSGVSSGDRVIDAHLNRFSNGQKVAVLN